MIYGMTDKEWHKVFVVFPKRMLDGRYAFLQTVERISYQPDKVPISSHITYSLIDGRFWCYREPVE